VRIRRCLFCNARVFYEDGGVCPNCRDATPLVVDVELPGPSIAVEPKPQSIHPNERTCEVCLRPSAWSPCTRCEESEYGPLGQRDQNW
jgi:hypothetical protein